MPAQDSDLVPQHEELDVLGGGRAARQEVESEHLPEDQVQEAQRHAGIMSDQRSPLVSDPGPTSGTPHRYKVHVDGFDQLGYFKGESDLSARPHFFYVSDDGDLTALRFDNWKLVFLEQRCVGTLQIWAEPYVQLRVPKLFNLRTDPYERADITSNTYYDWMVDRIFLFVPAQAYVAQMLQTLVEFPQRQKSASFSLDQVLAKLQDATTGSS